MDPVEYRAIIKLLSLEGRTPIEKFDEMKEIYGDNFTSYDVVKNWYDQFKCGRTSVRTTPIPGSLSILGPAWNSIGWITWAKGIMISEVLLMEIAGGYHQNQETQHGHQKLSKFVRPRTIGLPSLFNNKV